ncbi:MAG: radical SAM family heme chaperone HemW [Leptospirillia bacterium]
MSGGAGVHAGIYAALPFCPSRCHYCSNPATTYTPERGAAYLTRLLAELDAEAAGWRDRVIDSVYIGGGTPTLFPPEAVARLLEKITRRYRLDPAAEISIEANPETVTYKKAAALRHSGINRVSIGAQSFDPGQLVRLGRIHTTEAVDRAVDAVRSAGFDNVSLDLIFAQPGQTPASWEDSLKHAISLSPDHISVYGLTVEDGTMLAKNIATGDTRLPDPDIYAAHYGAAVDLLEAAGYARYEVSNFALPGFACRHNLRYWQGGDWLGVGAGAASHMGGHRFDRPADVDSYLAAPPQSREATSEERLNPTERAHEMAVFGLRTKGGIDLTAIHDTAGAALPDTALASLDTLREQGLVSGDNGHFRPTSLGFLHHDTIGAELASS